MAERQLCGCLHHSFSEASPRPFNRSPTGMPTREYTGGISYRTCFPSNPSSSPRESTFVHTIAPVLEDFHRGEFGGVHEILRFLLIWSFDYTSSRYLVFIGLPVSRTSLDNLDICDSNQFLLYMKLIKVTGIHWNANSDTSSIRVILADYVKSNCIDCITPFSFTSSFVPLMILWKQVELKNLNQTMTVPSEFKWTSSQVS